MEVEMDISPKTSLATRFKKAVVEWLVESKDEFLDLTGNLSILRGVLNLILLVVVGVPLAVASFLLWFILYQNLKGLFIANPALQGQTLDAIFWWSVVLGALMVLKYVPKHVHLGALLVRIFDHDGVIWLSVMLKFGIILPLILILVGRTVLDCEVFLELFPYYQPGWAEWINYHYEDKQEFIPSIILVIPYFLGATISILYLLWRKQKKKNLS